MFQRHYKTKKNPSQRNRLRLPSNTIISKLRLGLFMQKQIRKSGNHLRNALKSSLIFQNLCMQKWFGRFSYTLLPASPNTDNLTRIKTAK